MCSAFRRRHPGTHPAGFPGQGPAAPGGAQRLFDTVAAHGKGNAGAIAEGALGDPEQAQAGFREAGAAAEQPPQRPVYGLGRRSTLGDP